MNFRKTEDMLHLLVETESIRRVDSLIENIASPNISSRQHVIGTRGFGKSTILNYITFRIYSNINEKAIIPIHATLLGTATDEKDLEFIFFRSLLESLFYISKDIKKFHSKELFPDPMNKLANAEEEYKIKLKEFGEVTIEFIYTAFENQLQHLGQSFHRIVFLIDGLDKQDTNIVLKFLRNTQERLNDIIGKFNCIFIDAADPSWRATLDSKEFSGVKGITINLRGWTVEEVETLIKKRLERVGTFVMPFDHKALTILVEDFQGNPREILQYATTLLHYAAKERHLNIGPGIARKIVWSEDAKEKFFEKVISDTDFRYAFEKLKTVYPERQMMNIMVAIFNQRSRRLLTTLDYDGRSSIGITLSDTKFQKYLEVLLNKGCIKRSKQTEFVKLEDDLLKLYNYVMKLGQSLVALPVVLTELEFKVRPTIPPPKEEVVMKAEIQRVFEQNPNRWLDYEKIKLILLDNPKTTTKFKEHFKDDYEKKLTMIIPLMVHKFREEGKLIFDESSTSYRWRPFSISYETAQLFNSADILDKLDMAEKSIISGDLNEISVKCNEVISSELSNIYEIYAKNVDVSDIKSTVSFLKLLGLETERPIPLELFLSDLKNEPSDIDEAKVRLQTVLLFAKRMHRISRQLEQYETKNEELINKLQTCEVGVSKETERHDFNDSFLPLLLEKYGKLVDLITNIKTKDGFITKPSNEFKHLIDKRWLLPAKLFECPKCKRKMTVSAEQLKIANCQDDKVPLVFLRDVYILSNKAYEAWTVWLEEYSRHTLQELPCIQVKSGICLKPLGIEGVTNSDEVDVVTIFNGLLIAVECVETLVCNQTKNDVSNIISKIGNLGLFDAIILVYRAVGNAHSFNSELKKHKKLLYPIEVQNPHKFKAELHKTLLKIQENIRNRK